MISINLNAAEEWERVRRNTEPETPDVDRNPGSKDADRPELDNGTHGLRVTRRRRRGQDDADGSQESADSGADENEAYEVDIGEGKPGFAPPPDGAKAPVEHYRGQNVDLEA
ncbi:MAG: hypothetical protein ACOC2Y_04430 [Spirochaetota bacterium]